VKGEQITLYPIFLFKDKYINHNNMAQIIKGDEIQMFDENNQALLYATSHTLTITGNTSDTSSKDHGLFQSASVTSLSWEITAECLYTDNNYDKLFNKMLSGEKQFIKWAKVGNYDPNGLTSTGGSVQKWIPADVVKQGYAYITSLVANANTGETATFSVTFTGAGALTESSASGSDYKIEILYSGNFPAGQPIKLFNNNNDIAGYELTDATNNISSEIHASNENTYTPTLATTAVNINLYIEKPKVPNKLFENITAMTRLIIGNTGGHEDDDINELGSSICAGCTGLTTVSLNEHISGLSYRTFAGCTNLDELWIYFVGEDPDTHDPVGMPYNANSLALNGTSEELELYVPDKVISWYEQTTPWSNLTINSNR